MNIESKKVHEMIKFYWNGVKDNSGKLQRVLYSASPLRSFPEGTLTLYKRDYLPFSAGVREALAVTNGSDVITDYFETDTIRIVPSHSLYAAAKAAHDQAVARR